MSLKSDDCDVRDVDMTTCCGGNGDYYILLTEYISENCSSFHSIGFRMAMSGGFTRKYPEVRETFIAFHRAMEAAGLNEYPKQEELNPTKLVDKNWYLCLLSVDEVPIFCRYNQAIDMLAQVTSHSWGFSENYHSIESMLNVERFSIKSKLFAPLDLFLDRYKGKS